VGLAFGVASPKPPSRVVFPNTRCGVPEPSRMVWERYNGRPKRLFGSRNSKKIIPVPLIKFFNALFLSFKREGKESGGEGRKRKGMRGLSLQISPFFG